MRQPNDRRRDPFALRAYSTLTAVVVIGILLSMMLGPASATTQVQGDQDGLQIDAQNSSIREILDALSAKFKLTYSLPPGISRSFTGRYSGSLNRALARILVGNDYVLEVLDGRVEVVVFGTSDTTATPPISQTVVTSQKTATPVAAPSKSSVAPKVTPPSSASSPPPLSTYLSAN